jgi:tetratricopeptide (TPR) repeat protein
LSRRLQLTRVRAEILRDLGVSARKQGNYIQAKVWFEEALTCFRGLEDRRDEGVILLCFGSVALGQEDYPEAQRRYKQALRIFQEIGDRWSQGITLNNLCAVSYTMGHYAEAEQCFEQAKPIFLELQDYMTEAHLYHNAGNLARDQGDALTARNHYDYGLELSRRAGDQYVESFILANFGLLDYYSGNSETAYDYCCRALELARKIGAKSLQALALTFSGHALIGLDRLPEAETVYQEALALRRTLREHRRAITPLAGLAQIALAQGHLNQAHGLAVEILDYLETQSLAGVIEPFQVYLSCYRALQANQDPRAGEVLARAHDLLQEQAAKIKHERLQRSFLENVAAHQELAKEYGGIAR